MTATIPMHESRDRMILWAIVVSILLHSVAFIPGIRDAFKKLDINLENSEAAPTSIEFTLVSPPEKPTPTDEQSRFLSTASSAARDVVRSDMDSDVPHGDGRVPIPDNPSPRVEARQEPRTSDSQQMPDPANDLGDAFEKSKFREKMVQTPDLTFPDETEDFANKGSARASIGGISLNTTAWDFAPYLLDLKHRIKQHWIPPLAFTALGAIHGYTWVRFRIYPDGSMEQMEVVESEGHESLHRSSTNAIKGAAPFRKLPDHFPEPYLDVTFGFYYLLPGDEERFFKKNDERSHR